MAALATLAVTSALSVVGVASMAGAAHADTATPSTATPGTIFYSDVNNSRILAVSPDGTRYTVASGLSSTPYGVAADAEGNVWVADGPSGLLEVTPDGTVTSVPVDGLQNAWQVAVDHDGDVYVVDNYSYGRLFKVSADGTSAQVDTGGFTPQSVAVDKDDNVYLTDQQGGQSGQVVELHADGTEPTTLANDLYYPQGIAVDNDGNVWVADPNNDRFVRIAADGTETYLYSDDVQYPQWIAVDQAGSLYATSGYYYGSGSIYEVHADGSADLVSTVGSTYAYGIAVSPIPRIAQDPSFTSSVQDAAVGDRYDASADAGASNNPVTFSADPESADVCTVKSHNDDSATVTLTGTGTCTIDAAQAANRGYFAGAAQQSFDVKADGSLAFTSHPSSARFGGSYQATAAGDSSGAVTFASGTPNACSVSEAGLVNFLRARDCTVLATQAGTAGYLAGSATQTIQTHRAIQTVEFTSKAPHKPHARTTYHATASGNGTGARVRITAVGACSVGRLGVVRFSHRGSCTVFAHQLGNANYKPGKAKQFITVLPVKHHSS